MSETLGQLWLETVRRSPSSVALIDGESGRSWSRAELQAAVDAWRAALPAGIKLAGQKVTLAEPNGPGWLTLFIGLLLEDAVVVPLDPAEPLATRDAVARSIGIAASWQSGRLEPLSAPAKRPRRDLCLVKLTSGSTGEPRALVFTHAQMIADGRQVCSSMGIRSDDLNLGIIPFGHSYGLGNLIAPLLVQGTAILTSPSPLPHALAADCARWKATVFPAVPTLLSALVQTEVDPVALASLRLVISAGAPLSPEVATGFAERFGRRIHSFYGSSETGGITFDRTGQAALTGRSVGTAMDGVRLEFRPGRKFSVESAAVTGRGRFSPSDRAELNAFGELVLLGRTGRTVKIAGRRVDLGEIESLLRTVPGITDAYVVVHPTRSDALAAAVAGKVDLVTLRNDLRARTALWKIPERIVVLAELPRNARGKIDRRQIESLLRSAT